MKRKSWILLLLALSMLLSACSSGAAVSEDQSPSASILFYYRNELDPNGYDGEVLAIESRTYSYQPEQTGMEQLLEAYFAGPASEGLDAVFPKGTQVVDSLLEDGLLTLWLSGDYSRMTGMEQTLALACLTYTVTQLDGVDRLSLLSQGQVLTADTPSYTTGDFALLDTGSLVSEKSVKLYFSDENSRYLLTELRQISATDPETAAVYLIDQLLQGPGEYGHYATMPKDTRLIQLTISDGLCTLDLSADFLENRPRTEAAEWMTVYSVVNTLTELEEIDRVLFLCEGETIGIYRYMDLSQPLTHFDALVGPVRYGLNEYDATVYLGCWSNTYLAAVPTRIRQSTAAGQEAQLLQALLEYEPPVGYENLIPAGTKVLSVDTADGVCSVDLSEEFLVMDTSNDRLQLRIYALAATLCSLTDITSVQLTIQGNSVVFGGCDLQEPIALSQEWLFP